ncbi:MAG: histidinol-phosphatase [Candidatus Methanodesulfokora sp.]
MNFRMNYHVHTLWSDGDNTVMEVVMAAEGVLDEIAITDHLVIKPDGSQEPYSIPVRRIGQYLREIESMETEVKVLKGLEVDYFPGSERRIEGLLKELDLDIVIGSVHFVDMVPIDKSDEFWAGKSQREVDEIYRRYYELVEMASSSGLFDVIGHLDLPKKFGRKSSIFPENLLESLEFVEINTSGLRYPANEVYPSESICRELVQKKVKFTVGTDAHSVHHITFGLDKAEKLLKDISGEKIIFRNRNALPI